MKKKHLAEIRRITDSIPKHLMDNLMKEELESPTIKEIAMRGLEDPSVSDRDKARFRAMLDSGMLDRKVKVVDPVIEKQIDEYMDAEFKKARELGRLPPPQKTPTLLKKARKNYVSNNTTESTKESA